MKVSCRIRAEASVTLQESCRIMAEASATKKESDERACLLFGAIKARNLPQRISAQG
jgi:hypothetical protein